MLKHQNLILQKPILDTLSIRTKKSYIDESFTLVENIIKTNSKSFSFASQFLDRETRKSVVSLYAFCRMIDDIVDESTLSDSEKNGILDEIEQTVEQLYFGDVTDNPVLLTFGITIRKHNIPINYIHELIEGMRMDLIKHTYNNFDELYLYSYRVASTVGLMMTHIFISNPSESTLEKAESLGVAMQLTNILRDIKEDLERGRLYIPGDWLAQWGVDVNEFNNEIPNKILNPVIRYMISVARKFYQKGYDGVRDLPPGADFVVELSGRIYEGILNEIEKHNYRIFEKRHYVSKFKKIIIALKLRLKYRKSLSKVKLLNAVTA